MTGLRFVSAVDVEIESAVLDGLYEAGHDVVARALPEAAGDLAAELRADAVLVAAHALDRAFVARCDAVGVRIVAFARDPEERRRAIEVDLFEIADPGDGWAGVAACLALAPLEPQQRTRTAPVVSELRLLEAGDAHDAVDEIVRPHERAERAAFGADGGSASPTVRRRRDGARMDDRGSRDDHDDLEDFEGPPAASAMRATAMPRVVAVWGPVGAPGRTTVAINLAAELAALDLRVVLVDADSYGASIATHLGLLDETPGFAIACRAASTGDLDARELERVAQTTGSRPFSVLAGLSRVQRWPELSASRTTAVLDACRSWADVTVVDAGFCLEEDDGISSDVRAPSRNAATVASLRAADRVVAVGSGDPVGMSRLVRAHLDLAELVDPRTVDVVVNRVRASAVGMAPGQQIERTLRRFGGIDRAHLVPEDVAACDAAVLAGQPLREAAPKSAARSAIARYAEDRIAPAVAASASRPPRRLSLRRIAARA